MLENKVIDISSMNYNFKLMKNEGFKKEYASFMLKKNNFEKKNASFYYFGGRDCLYLCQCRNFSGDGS